MPTTHRPSQNHLLAALPTVEFERLSEHLELVALRLGDMLYEPGGQLQYAYFPTTAIVSLHYVLESGASAGHLSNSLLPNSSCSALCQLTLLPCSSRIFMAITLQV